MSLLAKYLADVDSNYTIAGTDREDYNRINFLPVRSNGFSCYGINFNSLLPVPCDDTSLADILEFKRYRKDELINFRNIVDLYQTQISNANEEKEIKKITIKFSENLEKGLKDLTKVLKESNISTIWSTFKTLIDIKSPTFIGTIGTIVNHSKKIFELPIEYSLSGIFLTATIEIGSKYIEAKNKKSAALRDSPFSYLYHAKLERII